MAGLPRLTPAARASFLSVVGAAGLVVLAAACGESAQQVQPPSFFDAEAEQFAARLNCTTCHAADQATEIRIGGLAAPSLAGIGQRRTLPWLRAYLADPQAVHPGTRMPDALADVPAIEYDKLIEDLLAYLCADGSFVDEPVEVSAATVAQGERLFHTIGCLPCHADAFADRDLADKTSIAHLEQFLLDPLRYRPGGEMPAMGLSTDEARALAAWLLRVQQSEGQEEMLPGLRYSYYEAPSWPNQGEVDWDGMEPVEVGTAATVHHQYGTRRERYGLVFTGMLRVPEDGSYEFRTRSDDGSGLYLDGALVVDNFGNHAPQDKRSQIIELQQGMHELRITFFENGGGEELQAGWSGPGFDSRSFLAEELFHGGSVPRPQGWQEAAGSDLAARDRGRQTFFAQGCLACHGGFRAEVTPVSAVAMSAPAWADLAAEESGCLAEDSAEGAPDFVFDAAQRSQLVGLLADRAGLRQTLTPAQHLGHAMAQLQCNVCHALEGVGGPVEELKPHFTGTDDLGDEGRYPPDLGGVGTKLKRAWMDQVIGEGAAVRPAMVTRMPAFGEALAQSLGAALVAADLAADGGAPAATNEAAFDKEAARKGWKLVGSEGLNCLICHDVAGQPSLGVHGPDLATMYERLQPEWFRRWLRDPHKMRPGTRMSVFFPEGRSVLTDVYDGDAERQIDAIWHYLSLGRSMPLPTGLVVDSSAFQLLPVGRPVYFGTFMQGLSARVTTVGFPERVNLAFDARNVRLAKVWQGDFINAQGTWQGRAGQLESPAGEPVLDLPAGAAFAVLEQADSPWPEGSAREAGWRMLGHRRDADGHPTFRYAFDALEVEESLHPDVAPGAVGFERVFVVRTPTEIVGLYLRTVVNGAEQRLPVTFAADPDAVGGAGFRAEISTLLKW